MGSHIELLAWNRRHEGNYKRKTNKGLAKAYSRIMVCEVTTDVPIGFLGRSHVVMACHMHHMLASGKFGAKRFQEFWENLAQELGRWEIQVLMGDFYMSLFELVPRLRSCGVQIEVGAW